MTYLKLLMVFLHDLLLDVLIKDISIIDIDTILFNMLCINMYGKQTLQKVTALMVLLTYPLISSIFTP